MQSQQGVNLNTSVDLGGEVHTALVGKFTVCRNEANGPQRTFREFAGHRTKEPHHAQ